MSGYFTGTDNCLYQLTGEGVRMIQTQNGKADGRVIFDNTISLDKLKELVDFVDGDAIDAEDLAEEAISKLSGPKLNAIYKKLPEGEKVSGWATMKVSEMREYLMSLV